MAEINESYMSDSLVETLKRTAKETPEERRARIDGLKKAMDNFEDFCDKNGIEVVEGAPVENEATVIFPRNRKHDE